MPTSMRSILLLLPFLAASPILTLAAADRVKVDSGILESTTPPENGVRVFKGIPFAQPPVGDLRWREPRPVPPWKSVRQANDFGPRCMQRTSPGADYWFRSATMSEDCLYLNVWTPAKSPKDRLPVLVYVYGGGFQNGDGSEPRYDGANMASKGIVAVTLNYRLNVFGFFAHPELTAESPHHASGNYGFLDQVAALAWVRRNIAAFGGDPRRVTVAGESAGSISVSALMASPLSKELLHGAIGESGALISTLPPRSLAETEKDGLQFAASAGADSLKSLRAISAEKIQEASAKGAGMRFRPNLDGYFLPQTLQQIFAAGQQAKVPLLAGSNTEEQGARAVLGSSEPTPEAFAAAVRRLYGAQAEGVLKAYAASTPEAILQAATDLASARFIGHGTWKWAELQLQTGGHPVYRYMYARPRPAYTPLNGQAQPPAPPRPGPSIPRGAVHSAEIQYAMGNLPLDKRYAWDADDAKVSEVLQGYFLNFIKTGNPNGAGRPDWPAYTSPAFMRMRIDVTSRSEAEPERARYLALDAALANQ
ncbi:MAG: carboxylesterase family protein [Acidobacteria bacterium]|nr:carboxylesterase family protein [Acidobacteriota bacterium]